MRGLERESPAVTALGQLFDVVQHMEETSEMGSSSPRCDGTFEILVKPEIPMPTNRSTMHKWLKSLMSPWLGLASSHKQGPL